MFSQGSVNPDIYLDDIPSSATYVIKTDGTNYWAVRYDGRIMFESTNASYTINEAVSNGDSIVFKAGIYSYSTSIVLPYDETKTLKGEGRGNTIFEYSGNDYAIKASNTYTQATEYTWITHTICDIAINVTGANSLGGLALNGMQFIFLNRIRIVASTSIIANSCGILVNGSTANGVRSSMSNINIGNFETLIDIDVSHFYLENLILWDFTKYGLKLNGYNSHLNTMSLGNTETPSGTIGIYTYNSATPAHSLTNVNIEWELTEATSYVFSCAGGFTYIDNLNIHNGQTWNSTRAIHLFKSEDYGGYYITNLFFDRKPITEGTLLLPLALNASSNQLASFNNGKPITATQAIINATIPSGAYDEGEQIIFYGFNAWLIGGQNGYEHEVSVQIENDQTLNITTYGYDDHLTTFSRNGINYQFAVVIQFFKAETLASDTTVILRVKIH